MDNSIKIYDRVKLKENAIFGIYLGDDGEGKVYFQDEETHLIKKYDKERIEKTYDKY